MQVIRKSVLQAVFEYAADDDGLVTALNRIVAETGREAYSVILHVLTHLNIEAQEAERCWKAIVAHRQELSRTLARPVNLRTSICDYFCSINKSFQNPVVIEISIFEKRLNAYKFDSLTGLYTRDFFNGMLERELARAKRYETELSLLFLDLDDFKRVNDTHGHLVGDEALRSVARIVMDESRSEDTAARFGGEEMVVLLPETGKIKALIVGERIRERIAKLDLAAHDTTLKLTVSGGIASYPIDGRTAAQLIESADKAMYQAKGAGKNNIVLFSPEQRQYLRVSFDSAIQVRTIDFDGPLDLTAQSKNICSGGILFESAHPMDLGTKLQLQIPVTAGKRPMTMIGTVVRVETLGPGRWDIGIAFLEMDKPQKDEIARYMSRRFAE